MIYTLVSGLAADGLSWLEFALATLVATSVIYVGLYIVGWLVQLAYSYVWRGNKTVSNFMTILWGKAWPGVWTDNDGNVLDGWYRNSDLGYPLNVNNYVYIRNGIYITKCEDVSGVSGSINKIKAPRTDASWESINNMCELRSWSIFLFPAIITAVLLAFDTAPILVIVTGLTYGVLRMARAIADFATKFEEHTKDKDAHE